MYIIRMSYCCTCASDGQQRWSPRQWVQPFTQGKWTGSANHGGKLQQCFVPCPVHGGIVRELVAWTGLYRSLISDACTPHHLTFWGLEGSVGLWVAVVIWGKGMQPTHMNSMLCVMWLTPYVQPTGRNERMLEVWTSRRTEQTHTKLKRSLFL